MKKLLTILFSLCMVCCLMPSCGESDCSLSTTSYARFDFLDSKTHKTVSLVNGATITGIVTIADTMLTDTLLNQAHYSETLRDTIQLTHKNIPFVSDIECGSMMFYKVEQVAYTTNVLDSVTLVNPDINNEEKKNFNIYYRTADDE